MNTFLKQVVTKVFSYGLSLGLLIVIGCQKKTSTIRKDPLKIFISHYHNQVDSTLLLIEQYQNIQHIDSIKKGFPNLRFAFKKLEPVMAFIDLASYTYLNQPNLPKVDETDNAQTISIPTGFQVLEETLFSNDTIDNLEVHRHLDNIYHRLKWHRKAKENLSFLKTYHILWMFRDSYTRIMAFGITGFDSPILQNSLIENQNVFQALQNYLQLFQSHFNDVDLYTQFQNQLKNAQKALKNESFNHLIGILLLKIIFILYLKHGL